MPNRKLTKEYIIQYLKKYYVAAKDIPKSKDIGICVIIVSIISLYINVFRRVR